MHTLTNPGTAALADQLERSFRGGAWHGPAVHEAIHAIDPELAAAAPADGGRSIQELARHLRHCMEFVVEQLTSTEPGSLECSLAPDEEGASLTWGEELAALEDAHRRLVAVVAGLDDARLDEVLPHTDATRRGLLLGILQHNAYHTGQIVQRARAGKGATP